MKNKLITLILGIILFVPLIANAEDVSSAQELINCLATNTENITINLTGNIDLTSNVTVNSTTTINFNGFSMTSSNASDDSHRSLAVSSGNTLTINATGSNSSNIVYWAKSGSELIINGGSYTNDYDRIVYTDGTDAEATLTIKNATMDNKCNTVFVNIGVTANIENSTISNTSESKATIETYGKLTITGGKFVSNGNTSIWIESSDKGTGSLEISNATIENTSEKSNSIYAAAGSSIIISNGTFTSKNANIINCGTGSYLKILNGTFSNTNDGESEAAGIYSDGTVEIYNGTFSSDMRTISTGENSNITIYDGTFNSTAKDRYLLNAKGKATIQGGSFTSNNNGVIYADDGSIVQIKNATLTGACGYKAIDSKGTGVFTISGVKINYLNQSVNTSTYKVIFMLDSDTKYKEVTVGSNGITTSTNIVTNPTKSGYTFNGWYYDEDKTDEFTGTTYGDIDYSATAEAYACSIANEDVVLYADWKKASSSSGSASSSSSSSNTSSSSSNSKENPTTGLFIGTGAVLFIGLAIGILVYSKKKSVFLKY